MNFNNTQDEFEDITYNWKLIFADFIGFVLNDDNNICGHNEKFEILRDTEADTSEWSEAFLKEFTFYVFINTTYLNTFTQFVFMYFNELQFYETHTYEMAEYLRFLCVQLGIARRYEEFFNYDLDTMEPPEKKWFCSYLIISTSVKFVRLHPELIEQIFTDILTPKICLK